MERGSNVTKESFGRLAADVFPKVANQILEDERPLHIQVLAVRVHVERAAFRGNMRTVRRGVKLFDYCLANGDSEVQNAVHVSFLEHIDPQTRAGKRIYDQLTPALKQGWEDITNYLKELLGSDQEPKSSSKTTD